MLTTKFTYPYRGIAAAGFAMVLAGLFLPFVTITNGVVDPYATGDSPSGWDLANLNKNKPLDQNFVALIFALNYAFLILAPIGLAMAGLGKDARGVAIYLAYISGFLLLTTVMLLPAILDSIPLPGLPEACTDASLQAVKDQYGDTSQQYLDAVNGCKTIRDNRARVLSARSVTLAPSAGLIIALVGAVAGYVGARLVSADEVKRQKMEVYVVFLKEVHKDGKVTKEEEDLLALERRLHNIGREDHELCLKYLFPDPKQFEYAVYQHQNPIDMDRMILEKHLQDYEQMVAQAYRKGDPTDEEMEMLAVIRRQLNIAPSDHDMILTYLIQEGRVPMPRTRGPGMGTGGRSMPPAPGPAAGPRPPPEPMPARSPSPASRSPPSPPSRADPPAPARTTPAAEDERIDPGPSRRGTVPPSGAPAPASGPKRVKCPKCKSPIQVTSALRPLKLSCTACGYSGTLK